jgi:hypothetical protein
MKLLCITWIIICEKNKNKISQHLNSSKIQSQNGSKWIPITHINLTAKKKKQQKNNQTKTKTKTNKQHLFP